MGEADGLPGREVGKNFAVNFGLHIVAHQEHDHLRRGGGFFDGSHFQAVGGGPLPALAALVEAHHYLDAAVLQVLGMGVPLAAVAEHGNFLLLDQVEIHILVVVNLEHLSIPPWAL